MASKTPPWWIIERLYTASTRALPPFLPLLPTVPPPAFKVVLPYMPFAQVCWFAPFAHSYSYLPPVAVMKVMIYSVHTVDLHWVNLLAAPLLEWVAMPFSRGSPWPRDQTQVSLPSEPPGKKHMSGTKIPEWQLKNLAKELLRNLIISSFMVFLLLFFKKTFWCGPFFKKSLLNLSQYCFCFMFWLLGCKACGI